MMETVDVDITKMFNERNIFEHIANMQWWIRENIDGYSDFEFVGTMFDNTRHGGGGLIISMPVTLATQFVLKFS